MGILFRSSSTDRNTGKGLTLRAAANKALHLTGPAIRFFETSRSLQPARQVNAAVRQLGVARLNCSQCLRETAGFRRLFSSAWSFDAEVIVGIRTNNKRETATGHGGWAPRDVRRLVTIWLGGVGLGPGLVTYGVYCLISGHTILPADPQIGGQDLDVYGSAAVGLAIAYIALGVLAHVHWFWGLYPRVALLCAVTKVAALLVFLGAFGFGIFRILASWAR